MLSSELNVSQSNEQDVNEFQKSMRAYSYLKIVTLERKMEAPKVWGSAAVVSKTPQYVTSLTGSDSWTCPHWTTTCEVEEHFNFKMLFKSIR